MSPEQRFRRTLVRKMRAWHAVAVENGARAGTPDLNWLDGWVELKVVDRWPALPETPVRLHRFSPQQRAFLRQRWALGASAYLLALVAGELHLFQGGAVGPLGTLPKAQFRALACYIAPASVAAKELVWAMRTHRSGT